MYLTYEEYKSYGGTLDETTFNDYEYEASVWLDFYTSRRLVDEEEISERVKRCMNKLIQLAQLQANALILGLQTMVITDEQGKQTTVQTPASIASQSNDGVSVSYNTVSASETFKLLRGASTGLSGGNLITDTIEKYLYGEKNSKGELLICRWL